MPSYHDQLKTLAQSIGSDGCTNAAEWYQECCWEHDWTYVTGMTPRGVSITKAEADQRFRDCLQRHSSFLWLSPMSWWRYLAVRKFGRGNFDRMVTVVPINPIFRNWEAVINLTLQAEASRKLILKEMGM